MTLSVDQLAPSPDAVSESATHDVEAAYQARVRGMSMKEKVARTGSMFRWMRDAIGRQITREAVAVGVSLSDEELKLRIMLRLYSSEPAVVDLIQRRLENVSGRATTTPNAAG